MKITELNIDCMEEILQFLNLKDLLNVADSNKRLNRAACLVYAQKYGTLSHVMESFRTRGMRIFLEIAGTLTINGLYTSLRFVRCFGSVISRMKMNATEYCHDTKLIRYVNEFCAKSLIELELTGWMSQPIGSIVLAEIHKPFEKIEQISIKCCLLDDDLMMINKWFPQLKHLYLKSNVIVDSRFIAAHFPYLENFQYYKNDYLLHNLELNQIEDFIHLNPQLKALELDEVLDIKLLRYIGESLNRLENLKIGYSFYTDPTIFKDFSDIAMIRFKSVKKLSISVPGIMEEMPFSFDQLEDFTTFELISDILLDFLKKHPSITKLTFNNSDLSEEDISQAIKVLPSLSNLDVATLFSANEVIPYMIQLKQFKKLKKFTFEIEDKHQVNYLQTKLDQEWSTGNSNESRGIRVTLIRSTD